MALRTTPNVFVMSSMKGLRVAEPLVSVLADGGEVDVQLWRGAFEPGATFLETLRTCTLRFDFGVLVITPDDVAQVRDTERVQPRDNVIFELGLFYSALGQKRALPVVVTVDGTRPDLPTDLLGLPTIRLAVQSEGDMRGQIEPQVLDLRRRMLDLYAAPEFGLLPATALAIGYFNNFVHPLMEGLRLHREVTIGGGAGRQHRIQPGAWRLSICIPETLADATRESWAEMADMLGLEQAEIAVPSDIAVLRPYPFRVPARSGDSILKIYDTPTTLRTAFDAVRKLMPSATPGDYALADERSVSDFERTLRNLLAESGRLFLRDRIELIGWQELRDRNTRS